MAKPLSSLPLVTSHSGRERWSGGSLPNVPRLSCLLDLGPPPRTRHIQHHTKDPIPPGRFSFDCYLEKSEFSLHHIQPTKMQGGLRVHLFNLYLLGNLVLLQALGI